MNERELAEQVIKEVLSREEFQPHTKADLSWLDKIFEMVRAILLWLATLLESILHFFMDLFHIDEGTLRGLGKTGQVVLTLGGILIVCLLVFLLVSVVLKLIRKRSSISFPKSLSEELVSFVRDPDAPYVLACQYRDAGEWRLSFRYLFIALIVHCNTREFLTIHASKTNRRYLQELNQYDAGLASQAECFFQEFDWIWYGGRDLTEERLRQWFARYEELTAYQGKEADHGKEG